MSDAIRDRSLRLFRFLEQLTEMQSKSVRNLTSYDQVLWINDIPQNPQYCDCVAWNGNAKRVKDYWVMVKKPPISFAPTPPNALRSWIISAELENYSQERPKLNEYLDEACESTDDDEQTVTHKRLFLHDDAKLVEAWAKYLDEKWIPWARKASTLSKVQKVYAELFAMYQKQQRLGEAYEIVLSIGYLTWKIQDTPEIRRHLIIAQSKFSFNPANGEITVGPPDEGLDLTLEQDMIEPHLRPDSNEIRVIDELLDEMGSEIWSDGKLHQVLNNWINSMPEGEEYSSDLAPHSECTGKPKLTFAPAIIMRKRTAKSLLRCYKDICEQIENGDPIPTGIEMFVEDPDNNAPYYVDEQEKAGGFVDDWEHYFPLPANDEQKQIAELIRTKHGILVQGPPGTGKSQTIANLICHLLAHGKKVLVTSHTARALTVLKNKIPEEIRELCIVALGNDRKELEASVRGITTKSQNWNYHYSKRQIDELAISIKRLRGELAEISNNIKAIREKETFIHPPVFGSLYSGTLLQIVHALKADAGKFDWIQSSLTLKNQPLLTDSQAMRLLFLLRNVDKSALQDKKLAIPAMESLISFASFSQLVQDEKVKIAQNERNNSIYQRIEYPAMKKAEKQDRVCFISSLQTLCREFESRKTNPELWVGQIADLVMNGKSNVAKELLAHTKIYLAKINSLISTANTVSISGIVVDAANCKTIKTQAAALLKYLSDGGKLGFWVFRASIVKDNMYLINDVKVNGIACDNVKTLSDFIDWLEVADALNALEGLWRPFVILMESSAPMSLRKAEFENLCCNLEDCLQIEQDLSAAQNAYKMILGLRMPKWHDCNDLRYLIETADAVIDEEALIAVRCEIGLAISRVQSTLSDDAEQHPIVREIINALTTRNCEKYTELLGTMRDICSKRTEIQECETLLETFAQGMKLDADSLAGTYDNSIWDTRLKGFVDAWKWKKTVDWIAELSEPEADKEFSRRFEILTKQLNSTVAKIAAEKAWNHCLRQLTESQRGHLRAWEMAMRAYGKGTGKYANKNLRDAQNSMEKCRSAIPAWIMPIYKVADSIKARPDIYDVVIVDEASQSGPEALFLQYIASRIVVVGDDKQISPESFIDQNDVELLRQRLIPDIPYSDRLGPPHSFFDQAYIRYDSSQIQLREHFRCMPEIIQFCNNLCYTQSPLLPLKQYGAGRLCPTIATVYIRNGYQKGTSSKALNHEEAAAIVRKVLELCRNPQYQGKTFGIISLLGDNQAKLILKLLTEQLSPKEMNDFNITCGDAYAFQGDERDVIFLSMVAAQGDRSRISTLSGPKAERRFNVAVSRAKEQMWLFHSFSPSEVNPNCLRHRLLKYCMNPGLSPNPDGLDIETLRRRAQVFPKNQFEVPDPFDSWFEVDVFLQIVERGFRVIPQYHMAGYNIDLMVMGMKGSLAVECDGDIWHGPEQYDADMARQRQLERSGCVFWRILGSVYYSNPQDALSSLWPLLEQMQIRPIADESSVSSFDCTDMPVDPNHESIGDTSGQDQFDETELEPSDDAEAEDVDNPVEARPSVNQQTLFGAPTLPSLSKTSNSNRAEQKPRSGVKTNSIHKERGSISCLDLINQHNLTFVDRRNTKNGALWILGGEELRSTMLTFKNLGFEFEFAREGARLFDGKQAWFMRKE